jgi:hypothetical protein
MCILGHHVVLSLYASCSSSGGDVESNVFITLVHTRTHNIKKKKKKNCTCYMRIVVITRRIITYGIRARFNPQLGIAMAFVDMIGLYYC